MWVFCVIWNFFRRGRPLCRPVVLYLVQTYKSAHNLKIFCHCEERSDVAIRFSLRRQYSFVQCKGDADSHDQFANWSRNDSKSFPRLLFSLSEITKDRRPLSHGSRRASVSLRLGHGAALTCPRHVIHYRAAASLPKRGAKRVRCVAIRHCKIFAAKRLPPHTWIFSFLICEKYAASTSWSSSRPPR